MSWIKGSTPSKVSWINSTALEVKQMSSPNRLNLYKDKIWCDMVTIDQGQIILGRPWLFDKDVTIYDRSNISQFLHKGKKIKLLPLRLKFRQPEQTPNALKDSKGTNLIGAKVSDQKLKKGASFFLFIGSAAHPPPLPPIATTISFFPTRLAYSGCQSLPLLPTPHHSRVSSCICIHISYTCII